MWRKKMKLLRDFLVDWDFPPIYDIYPNKDDLLKEVKFSVDIVKIMEDNNIHLYLRRKSKK